MTGGSRETETSRESGEADFEIMVAGSDEPCVADGDKVYEDLGRLQEQLESERDSRKEERFYWITALVVAADLSAFQWLGATQSILVFLLEVVFLAVLARHLGVDYAVHLLNELLKLLKAWIRRLQGGD